MRVPSSVRGFVAASERRRDAWALCWLLFLGCAGLIVAVSFGLDGCGPSTPAAARPSDAQTGTPRAVLLHVSNVAVERERSDAPKRVLWRRHVVIPAETLDDVAARYRVRVDDLARWNGLDASGADLRVGRRLDVHTSVNLLPQQEIIFEVDHDTDWASMSQRFGVPVRQLRAFNPSVDFVGRGTRLSIWIDPRPPARLGVRPEVPEFIIRTDARSVGAPNDGALENAVQLPESPLYVRRYPQIMWGSSHTISTLMGAVAAFRRISGFEHEIVIADISRRYGGPFPPHRSHQAGRDVDIWMPSLQGVYKRRYLGGRLRDRKPRSDEVDWYAAWGLIAELLQTRQVVKIFVDYALQENLYQAAVEMGDDALLGALQWPRTPGAAPGAVVVHAPGHTGHMHVRFKCGPHDLTCSNDIHAVSDGE